MHDIHYMRKYQSLANDGLVKPFLCSCGDPYAVVLADKYTMLEEGEAEVYFYCLAENYKTPVGLREMSMARRVVEENTKDSI